MIYLREFENHAAYEAAESSLILPNVSLCTQENDVHYNPYVDPYAGHEYVEIGGLKWATMNIGATGVTDAGLYFQWGDTQGYTASEVGSGDGKKYFGWADYKYGNGTSSPGATGMTKYNKTDGKTVLDASDDAVTAAWGGSWRMPTEADFTTLSAATISKWVANYKSSGVNGRLFTDKDDSSKVLFFPAAAAGGNSGSVYNVAIEGRYWSSSLNSSSVINGRYWHFGNSYYQMTSNGRYLGYSVRGVVGQ